MLSDSQRAALAQAKSLLRNAGLDATVFDDSFLPLAAISPSADCQRDSVSRLSELPANICPAVVGYRYQPPPAKRFTEDERGLEVNKLNRQTSLDAIIDHPVDVIIEYPEAGCAHDDRIGHRFAMDACRTETHHPKLNIQYSLGGGHGSRDNIRCPLLLDKTGQAVFCKNEKISCRGLKQCEAFQLGIEYRPSGKQSLDPVQEVFFKTLAFFCALHSKGCGFDAVVDGDEFDSVSYSDVGSDKNGIEALSDNITANSRAPKARTKMCRGNIILKTDHYNQPFIKCEHRKSTDTAHLIIRNLEEFNIPYLKALLLDDKRAIDVHEQNAKAAGYGPLVPCGFTAPVSSQKQICPHWHRFGDGTLRRGVLKDTSGCAVVFDIYTPYDLVSCPSILIVCRHAHSHPPPFPTSTPPPLLRTFENLLLSLEWKLADATPRKILVDSGFIRGLRTCLGWTGTQEPSLSDLHPSLGNMDHARRFINDLRLRLYPEGTGFKGAQLLAQEHLSAPPELRYVRCAEVHTLRDGTKFYLIICMSSAMSQHLMASHFVSIDTSFKRLHHKWQEFEIETWDSSHMKSVVGARAFTTSQNAESHVILFQKIFKIAMEDTSIAPQFFHIHGQGFRMFIADAHKGQALGLGQFCQSLCHDLDEHAVCYYDPTLPLRSFTAYDHLRCCLRLCRVHFMRNLHSLKGQVTPEVYSAMISLATPNIHPDLEAAFTTINAGGKKASAWLQDKISSKFVLPGIYRPMSLIPLETWQAAPSTTNGNEQSHRNVNRDGVNLTILGGIMRGMQYDQRSMRSLALHDSHGIYARDQEFTHFRRSERSLNRHVVAQKRTAVREPSSRVSLQSDATLGILPAPPGFEVGSDNSVLPEPEWVESAFFDPQPGRMAVDDARHSPSADLAAFPPLHIPVHASLISSHSELANVFTPGSHFSTGSMSLPTVVIPSSLQIVTPMYDPRRHLSNFSTLSGALG